MITDNRCARQQIEDAAQRKGAKFIAGRNGHMDYLFLVERQPIRVHVHYRLAGHLIPGDSYWRVMMRGPGFNHFPKHHGLKAILAKIEEFPDIAEKRY